MDAPQETDLWSSILDSVSRKRTVPAKQAVILGEPSSGKSTIVKALLQREQTLEEERDDFALGYDWADVRDDSGEDVLARLSVYTVPSSSPSYLSLLPHFLPPRQSIAHTVFIVVLDWTKPWTFMQQLRLWLDWIDQWAKGDGSRELEVAREENRERLVYYFQHYAEPSTDEAAPAPVANVSGTVLPLSSGVLDHNHSGISLIIACSKADLIDQDTEMAGGISGMGGLIKGKGGEWEERTDSVMQVLRTICLEYGASLFYTTQQPETLQMLREYAMHLLFLPPPPAALGSGSEGASTIRNPFMFKHRANALDRDRIMIPMGWDSWGKIGILRDGFDAKRWCDAWESDGLPASRAEAVDESAQTDGAMSMFEELVGSADNGKTMPSPAFVNPTAEQAFLAKHYDENSKKTDRDPRQVFRNVNEMHNGGANAGLVGPMGASSFSLPSVEQAMSRMEGAALQTDIRPGARRMDSAQALQNLNVGGTSSGPFARPQASPTAPGAMRHEVLHDFFQSLLSQKDRTSSPVPATPSKRATASSAEEQNS